MKTRIFGIAIIALSIIAFATCKKDAKETKNYLKYDDKESQIGTIYGGSLGQSPTYGVYGTLLYFMENTITLHQASGEADSLSGTGNIMVLTFLSNNSRSLEPGDYSFSASEDPFIAYTFGYNSGLLVNYNTASAYNPAGIELNGGKVTIKKNIDEYEFTFSINTKVNSTITGHYKGKIIPARFTLAKKSADKNPFSYQFLKY
jgi:hypothetical protein